MNESYPPRQDYNFADSSIRLGNVNPDPVEQFRQWYLEEESAGHGEPNRIALATSTPDGIPSLRMVLLKLFGAEGFIFFTDYTSRKSKEIESNPCVAILSHWPRLQRQVRIEGAVERTDRKLTEEYFNSRPRLSRAAASVSRQSSSMDSREEFENQLHELSSGVNEIDCPPNWGGYCLRPVRFEFWQGQPGRVHDRVQYDLIGDSWSLSELQP
ncbi:MAG: pyridoxamine 5'-phosphate oxidase [Planctomycetia bacterium TMED53]|nr:MAG: pyridoxamine 5'-phosphate oxidase [Planctomycetia bacterium TMED53]